MGEHRTETRKLLIISGVTDLVLGVLKVLAGIFSNSYALLVDGIHSLSDLATDVMVWIFNDIGSTKPDDDHPYGHAKFETFGTLILGLILLIVAIFIVQDTVTRLFTLEQYETPTWPGLLVALISIAGKEWLYQITARLGKKTNSRLLQANAWHHRTDALSSILVFIGIGAALVGYPWLELVAAIGVAAMIALIGWTLSKQSLAELVDTSLSNTYIDDIRAKISDIEGVKGVHSIRTRRMGPDALIDIHLQVDSSISVSEGHHIGDWVALQLHESFPDIKDIIVHIDPEDDEELGTTNLDAIAPLRKEAQRQLNECWNEDMLGIEILKINLHYLENKIDVELFLPRDVTPTQDINELRNRLENSTSSLAWLKGIRIWLS